MKDPQRTIPSPYVPKHKSALHHLLPPVMDTLLSRRPQNPFTIGIYASIDTGLCSLVYIPRVFIYNNQHTRHHQENCMDDRHFFHKCIDAIPDPEKFMLRLCRGTLVEKTH
jgi:hypothetical protein